MNQTVALHPGYRRLLLTRVGLLVSPSTHTESLTFDDETNADRNIHGEDTLTTESIIIDIPGLRHPVRVI